jgi:hypothetical protein
MALDFAGNAYLTGSTDSFNFPLENPLQDRKLGSALFKSTDAGATWTDVRLSLRSINSMVPDPRAPGTFYAVSGDRIIKSTDSGNSWTETGQRFASSLFFDRRNPATVYGLSEMRFYKSTDGGASSSVVDISHGNTLDAATSVVVDPKNSSTLYVGTVVLPIVVPAPAGPLDAPARSSVFKSTDGGDTWFPLNLGSPTPSTVAIAVDPKTPATLYAGVGLNIYKTTDEGSTWSVLPAGFFSTDLLIDPINTSTVYAASYSTIYKTTDGGSSWRRLPQPAPYISKLIISPQTPTTLYATGLDILKSTDGGEHWEVSLRDTSGLVTVDPSSESTLYLSRFTQADSFVTKVNAAGSAIVYSTYLGGFADERGKCIAVDPFGNVYVGGASSSANFPVTPNAFQTQRANTFTGFIVRITDAKSPKIVGVSVSHKNLTVSGESFDSGAKILIDGVEQKTRNDDERPSTTLIAKKAAKNIPAGQTVAIRVRNADGTLSNEFSFVRPAG